MEIPQETQELINYYLKMVRTDPNHDLLARDRVKIYDSFKAISDPQYQKFIGRLGILAAHKVLHFWELLKIEYYEDKIPYQMLDIAENLWQGNIQEEDIDEDIWYDFHYGGGSLLTSSEEQIPSAAKFTLCAAESALNLVRGLAPFQGFNRKQIQEGIRNELLYSSWGDSASSASCAYSYQSTVDGERIYDPEKRLEFWEWWLKEAISQAWELAHQNI